MRNNHYYTALIALIAISASLRFYSAMPLNGTDCIIYAQAAHDFIEHNFSLKFDFISNSNYYMRIGILFITAFTLKILGTGNSSLVISMLALHIIVLFISAFLIRKLFREEISLLFLLISAFIPIDISLSTSLFPDYYGSFLVSIAFLLSIWKIRYSKSINIFYVSGAILGAGWLFKESAVYSIPVLFAIILYSETGIKNKITGIILPVLGFLSIFVIEVIISKYLTGDYLTRLTGMGKIPPEAQTNLYFNEGSIIGYEKGKYFSTLMKRLFIDGPLFIFFNKNFSFVIFFSFISGIVWIFRSIKDAYSRLLFIWFAGTLIMQNFSSVSVKNYSPIPLFPRYEYPLIFPSVLLVSTIVFDLYKRKLHKERIMAIIIALCFITFSAVSSNEIYSMIKFKADYEHTIDIYRSIDDNTVLHTDNISKLYYDFYNGYKDKAYIQVHQPDSVYSCNHPKGDYILINTKYLKTYSMYGKGIDNQITGLADTSKVQLLDKSNTIQLYKVK